MNIPIISQLIGSANNVIKTIFGSKSDRDAQQHLEHMGAQGQFSKEFINHGSSRTWWDSLWDGLNRMPRPVMVILVLWYLVISYNDPIMFQKINVALDTIPDQMWYILSAIIAFYFGARELSKSREQKMALSQNEFKQVIIRNKQLDEMSKKSVKNTPENKALVAMSGTEESTLPNSVNPSIAAWKEKERLAGREVPAITVHNKRLFPKWSG